MKKTDGVEEMKKELSDDVEVEKTLAAENAKLLAKLDSVRSQAKTLATDKARLEQDDKASDDKLGEIVEKMESAVAIAKGEKSALVQMDPEPVMDKVPTGGVPEQGFEGHAVEHKDMETSTGDWGKEYGKDVGKPVPSSAVGSLLALAF